MQIRTFAVVALAICCTSSALAQERVDEATLARIRMEGFQHSQVMDTLSWLTDVHGPRLHNSPQLQKAGEWARDQLTRWGLQRAALEPYTHPGRGWVMDRFSVEMTAPQYMRVIAYPKAWSPAIAGTLAGTPVIVDVKSKADFERYKGKLKGAIVMNGRPSRTEIGFEPEATRLTPEDLAKQAKQQDVAPAGFDGRPQGYWEDEEEFDAAIQKAVDVWKFFASEGVAAVITPSRISEDVSVDGFYDEIWKPTYPGFVFSREHYGRIMRMLDKQQPVTLTLSLATHFIDQVQPFNVVAEIPGTDPALASEVVLIGGHLDSWHSGTGATDNGAGSAAVMEAMRILKTLDLKPRRTIRMALWSGEEEDYFGSMGYVEQHFADVKTMALKPEHATLAAYFNLDNGAGRIRGVNLQGNEMVRPIFEAWMKPFGYLGATTLTSMNTGGTDHMVFDAVGLPGFQFIQDPLNYETKVHHSNLDVYEQVIPDDLEQASVVLAGFAWQAAQRDEKLPRKPLPAPHVATPKK